MEWISVKNRLPPSGTYTITWNGKKVEILRFIDSTKIGEITHWMPLPKPPSSEVPKSIFRKKLKELNEKYKNLMKSLEDK